MEGLGLPHSGHSQLLLIPTDPQQNIAEPNREAGNTSGKHTLEKENIVQTLKNGEKSVRKNPKNTKVSEGERGTPGAVGDILLQPVSFGRDYDGFGISLELMERITPEQIFTLQHVEDPNTEQVDIS